MLFSRLRKSAFGAVLLAASVAAASDVLEDRLSFGHKGRHVLPPSWLFSALLTSTASVSHQISETYPTGSTKDNRQWYVRGDLLWRSRPL